MRMRPEQVEMMAHQVVRRLDESGLVRFEHREGAVEHVARALTADLQVEDRLNDEVRSLLEQHSSDVDKSGLEFHQMFRILKSKLIRERNLIL